MDDDETRARIKEIAAHCKTLLGAEDDDFTEGENAEAEGDPEVEKALVEMRKLVAQASELSDQESRWGMVRRENPRRGTFRPQGNTRRGGCDGIWCHDARGCQTHKKRASRD